MGKKILAILAVGLVFALIIPIGSSYADYKCKLSAIGVIRIDSSNSEIKGFILFGNNNGEVLRFTYIKIKYDAVRLPLELGGPLPYIIHNIKYNPAK
jgi:hypothetical protein